MRGVLDVVAFEDQWPTVHVNARDTGGTTGLVQVTLVDQRIGLLQHRQHSRQFVAADRTQAGKTALDAEQRALAPGLLQVILQAPVAHLVDLFLQGFQWQGVFGVGQ
ncbi:hypothetical protein D9M73_258230 [compost metagenome]